MSVTDDDLNKWKTWNKDPTPKNLSGLIKQMNPVIYKSIAPYQGSVAPAVLESEAKIQAVGAFKKYDPKRNVKLSTHLTNHLQKVSRTAYKHQDIFKVPEHRRIKTKTFLDSKERLEELLGREPTAQELSEDLGWSRAEVNRFFVESRQEFSDTMPYSSDFSLHNSRDDTMIAYLYNELSPVNKAVFEHLTGYNNKEKLSNTAIKKKLNLTQGQLSYAKTQLKSLIKGVYDKQ